MNEAKKVVKIDLGDFGVVITTNYSGEWEADRLGGRYKYYYTFELWEICGCEERHCPHKGDLLDVSYSEVISSPKALATVSDVFATIILFSTLKRKDTDIDVSYLPPQLLEWNEAEGSAYWELCEIGDILENAPPSYFPNIDRLNIETVLNVYSGIPEFVYMISLNLE